MREASFGSRFFHLRLVKHRLTSDCFLPDFLSYRPFKTCPLRTMATVSYSRQGRTTGLLMRAQLQRRLVMTTELDGHMRQRRCSWRSPSRGLTVYSKRRRFTGTEWLAGAKRWPRLRSCCRCGWLLSPQLKKLLAESLPIQKKRNNFIDYSRVLWVTLTFYLSARPAGNADLSSKYIVASAPKPDTHHRKNNNDQLSANCQWEKGV